MATLHNIAGAEGRKGRGAGRSGPGQAGPALPHRGRVTQCGAGGAGAAWTVQAAGANASNTTE